MSGEAPPVLRHHDGTRLARYLLVAIGVLSAATVMLGAYAALPDLATGGAAVFAFAVAMTAAIQTRSSRPLRANALLSALAYAWGAVAMQGAYLTPLTGLKWQHGWQYALAMALLAVGSLAFAGPVGRGDRAGAERHFDARLRLAAPLAGAQALIAAGGLAALAASGKLWSERADWVANRVFAGLALAILAISASYLVAGRRIRQS